MEHNVVVRLSDKDLRAIFERNFPFSEVDGPAWKAFQEIFFRLRYVRGLMNDEYSCAVDPAADRYDMSSKTWPFSNSVGFSDVVDSR